MSLTSPVHATGNVSERVQPSRFTATAGVMHEAHISSQSEPQATQATHLCPQNAKLQQDLSALLFLSSTSLKHTYSHPNKLLRQAVTRFCRSPPPTSRLHRLRAASLRPWLVRPPTQLGAYLAWASRNCTTAPSAVAGPRAGCTVLWRRTR